MGPYYIWEPIWAHSIFGSPFGPILFLGAYLGPKNLIRISSPKKWAHFLYGPKKAAASLFWAHMGPLLGPFRKFSGCIWAQVGPYWGPYGPIPVKYYVPEL